jgi:hypothetical protein
MKPLASAGASLSQAGEQQLHLLLVMAQKLS